MYGSSIYHDGLSADDQVSEFKIWNYHSCFLVKDSRRSQHWQSCVAWGYRRAGQSTLLSPFSVPWVTGREAGAPWREQGEDSGASLAEQREVHGEAGGLRAQPGWASMPTLYEGRGFSLSVRQTENHLSGFLNAAPHLETAKPDLKRNPRLQKLES